MAMRFFTFQLHTRAKTVKMGLTEYALGFQVFFSELYGIFSAPSGNPRRL